MAAGPSATNGSFFVLDARTSRAAHPECAAAFHKFCLILDFQHRFSGSPHPEISEKTPLPPAPFDTAPDLVHRRGKGASLQRWTGKYMVGTPESYPIAFLEVPAHHISNATPDAPPLQGSISQL